MTTAAAWDSLVAAVEFGHHCPEMETLGAPANISCQTLQKEYTGLGICPPRKKPR